MNQQQRLIRSCASLAMNDQGLRLLMTLEYDNAIICFHDGLMTLLGECQRPPCLETNFSWILAESLREKEAQNKESFGLATHKNLLFSASANPNPVENDIHDDILSIFDRALSVRVEFLHACSEEVVFRNLLIAVYFFNAGLAFHMKGLSFNNSDCLSKAAEHYAIGYARFLDCSKYYGNDVSVTLGLLATSNNIAHIHAFCRNMEQVEICIEELASTLACFVMQSGETQHDNDCRMFLQNVCYFRESVFASAPAA